MCCEVIWSFESSKSIDIKALCSSILLHIHLAIDNHRGRPPAETDPPWHGQMLPGARELLRYLTRTGIPWAIATSGRMKAAGRVVRSLEIDLAGIPVITRDMVAYAKPDPDLFLAAAEALKVDIKAACVVGDSIWDMLAARRAGALGVELLSGGYGQDELERSGAYRVYGDPADLRRHIDEVGGRV